MSFAHYIMFFLNFIFFFIYFYFFLYFALILNRYIFLLQRDKLFIFRPANQNNIFFVPVFIPQRKECIFLYLFFSSVYLPTLNHDGTICVGFDYHMFGQNIDTLILLKSSDNDHFTPEWTMKNDQGSEWIEAEVTLNIARSDKVWFPPSEQILEFKYLGNYTSKGGTATDNNIR